MKSNSPSWSTKLCFVPVMLVCFTILTAPLRCGAQSNQGTLRGTVTDPSGAAVPNAAVEIRNVAMNVGRKAVSNANGEYEVPYIDPGTYLITCNAPGFEKFVAQDVAIVGYETRRVDIQMRLGSATTAVTVTAGASVISTESAQITGGFTEKTYKDSPAS